MSALWEKILDIYNSHEVISHVVVPAAIIFFGYFAAMIVSRIIIAIGKKMASRTETTLDDRIFPIFNPTLKTIFFLGAIYGALASIPTEYTTIEKAKAFVFILVILMITVLFVKVFKTFVLWYREVMAPKTESQFDDEFMPLFQKVGVIILYVLGVIWILDTAGVNVSGLIVSLGVGGMALGLAAKDALANMIAGFMLMIDRPFREGDRIELDNGKIGNVVHLGVRTTRIRTFENTIIIVPNQELLQAQVTNHSYPDSVIRRQIKLGVAYGTDLKKAKDIIMDLCKKHEKVLDDPAPSVWVHNFGDSSMDIVCNIYVKELSDGWSTQCELTEQIYDTYNKKGIEIPFPIRTVHLHNEK